MRYSKYAGRYGGNDGICLFDDGRFMLYGYATAVFGSYAFEKDNMLFYPDHADRFEVFATQNKSISSSTRINFAGFDRGIKTFVRFGTDSIHRVFNENANCFNGPFVYEFPGSVAEFTLTGLMDEDSWYRGNQVEAWTFQNKERYNDFIFSYNAPKLEYEDFGATISFAENREVIKLSNYGGEQGYFKNSPGEAEQRQWQEILGMKIQYEQERRTAVNGIYANKHYRVSLPDTNHYIFDKVTNQYISRNAAENESYFSSNPYNDDRYLRRYIKLKHATRNTKDFPKNEVADSCIFFTTCGDGSGKSYYYKDLKREAGDRDNAPIATTGPVLLPNAIGSHKTKKEYTKDGITYLEDYENGELFRREAWDMNKSKATVRYFKNGKLDKREEIKNRYSLDEEIIETYNSKGKLLQRKVASLENNSVIYHIYDATGKLLKVERP